MAVFLDVKTRLDERLAQTAMREAVQMWDRAGQDIGKGLSAAISKALGAFDTSAARRELASLTNAHRAAADAEEAAANRMVSAIGRREAAQAKLNEITAKYGADSSRALAANAALADSHAVVAKAQRDHVDAMVAAEAGHQKLASATSQSADAASRAGAIWNGIGVASVAAYGTALVETTRKAGDFQQSQERLVASAGETQQNLKAVSDGILQLAAQVGYSAQDLSNAMYTVEKAGYRGADGVNVLKAAAQGAKSENSDLGEVLNGLTTSMHDFNYSQDQAADVMSRMVAATSLAKSTFQEFSGALHSAEPIAANIGKSQNLDPQQMQHLMSDVMGIGAQMTQTGMSANQAFDLMGHAYQKFLGPTQGMRDMLGALGIDAQDLSDNLGARGLAGTLQIVDKAIQDHTQNGKVNLDVQYQSAQAARAEAEAYNALPGPAKAVADQIKDGSLSYKEFRKSRGGLDVEMANELGQWNALNSKLTGYSSAIKAGIGDQMSMDQALKMATGDQETLQVALQTTGENAGQTNDKIKQLDDTTREHDGTVKGFNETQQTLNAKMADAKAAFGAAAIEIGSAFVPVMTTVANVAKTVGDAMAQHPRIMHHVIDALGLLGGAWMTFKALNIAETILTPIATSLGTIVAGEEGATAATTGLASAMSGLSAAVPLVAAGALAANSQSNAMKAAGEQTPEEIGQKQGSWAEIKALFHQTFWADGGAISGPGPKGKDSVPAWMAPGEHVLTASDVDAMGGQGAVYAFRNALHREAGGSGDPSDYGLPTNPGQYVVTPDKIQTALGYAASMQGQPYKWGGAGVGSLVDCSGFMSTIYGILTGKPVPAGQRYFTTESDFTKLGFLPGYDPSSPFNIGVNPQHMAGTLAGYNVESGGAADKTQIGGGAAGALNPEFTKHYHLPGSMAGMGDERKVAAAEEKVAKADARVKELEQKESELKASAKQSERDKLESDLKFAREDAQRARDDLDRARQSAASLTSGRSSSTRGSGAGLQFGAPLPANFGLGKGIPGFFEWLTTFAADMAIGPIEGAMLGNAIRSGQFGDIADMSGDTGDTGGSPGGYADLGSPGTPIPSISAADYAPGGTAFTSPGGGGAGSGGGAGTGASPAAAARFWGGYPSSGASMLGRGFGTGTAAASTPPSGPPAPPPAPSVPSRQLYGPPSPAASYSPDTLAKLGSIDGAYNMTGPTHVDAAAPGLPPDTIPRTPSGGIDYGALKQRFSGQVPLFPQAPPTSNYAKQWYSLPSEIPGFATGGPTGTDTIPAWLSPGEMVMNPQATKNNLQALQWMNAGHYDTGTQNPLQPPPPGAPKPQPGQQGAQAKPQPKPDQKPQPHIPVGGPSSPGPGNVPIPGGSDTRPGVATPGAATEQFGQELPPSGGIGFGGGIIGAAEGAASMGAGAAGGGPAAGAGMGAAFQALNRTAGYIGQLGGIAAEGILSTFLPADSALSNFSNTLPGKLIAGIAGVRPGTPNSAGKTESPLKPKEGEKGESKSGGDTHVGSQFNGPITVKADNPDQFRQQLAREYSGAQAAYPMRTP